MEIGREAACDWARGALASAGRGAPKAFAARFFSIRAQASRNAASWASWASWALRAVARALPVLVLSALWWGAAGQAWAAPKPIPAYSAPVVDEAGMLKPETRQALNARLMKLQRQKGSQIAVLTVASLDGEPIFDYGMRVAEKWKIGRKGIDDGALLLISKEDRLAQILTGYGVEGAVTDFDSKAIIDKDIIPNMKNNDPDAAVQGAVEALVALLETGSLPEGRDVGDGDGDGDDGEATLLEVFFGALVFFGLVFLPVYAIFDFLGPLNRFAAIPLCLCGLGFGAAFVVPSELRPAGADAAGVVFFVLNVAFWVGMWFMAKALRDRVTDYDPDESDNDSPTFGGSGSSGFGGGGGGTFGGGGAAGRW